MKKNEIYTAEITAITSEGNGICKIDGIVVFVPNTAIGDVIELRIVKVLKNFCFGKIERILTESSTRQEIDCTAFPRCGGCDYRHLSYSAELDIKQKVVQDAFERIGKISIEPQPILGCENTHYYRNKVQLPIGTKDDGSVTAGYYAARSHRLIPLENCLLQPQRFTDILTDLMDYFNSHHVSAYDEKKHEGILRHVYLRNAEQTQQIMVAVIATKTDPSMSGLSKYLVKRHPQIKSILWNINPDRTNVILGQRSVLLYGDDFITDRLCGKLFRLSLHSFYQVNHVQTEKLYALAAKFADSKPDDTIIDLYCGVGTIGLSMADKAKKIIGVEIVPQAVENAKENAKINQIDNAEFHCGDAKMVTALLTQRGISADIVLLDPPRKGCDQQVLQDIAIMSPQKIVMISCNPATAARDCNRLEALGYQVVTYRAVDMFPKTTHVETVVLMSKTKNDFPQKLKSKRYD